LTLGVAEFDLIFGLPTSFLELIFGVVVDIILPFGISTFNEFTRFLTTFLFFDLSLSASSCLFVLPFDELFVIFNGLSPIKPLQFFAPHLHGALSLLTDSKL
jgi:hypothetical protein